MSILNVCKILVPGTRDANGNQCDEAKGKWYKVKGKIKEVAGILGDNFKLEAENKKESKTGEAQ